MKIHNKGVSEIVSYVLLIVIVMSMSVLVYQYLQGFVPREKEMCPDGVSLIVRSYACNSTTKELTLLLQNKGLFTVDAYTIRASEIAENEIATKVLNKTGLDQSKNPGFIPIVLADQEGLEPGEELNEKFSYVFDSLAFIEITPFIVSDENKSIICGNAKIKEIISCS